MQNKPSKELMLQNTFTLPNSTRRMMSSKMTEMMLIYNARLENPFSTIKDPRIIVIRLKLKAM
jgi:hypothetical protein